jgi:DNA polymerase-3 subunit gamma/tau
MLSNHAFNALLKTLEEPPSHVVFIMATTELHKVPDTILSRCQQFEFRQIPAEKIYQRLRVIAEQEAISISETALREIARAGGGQLARRAIGLRSDNCFQRCGDYRRRCYLGFRVG